MINAKTAASIVRRAHKLWTGFCDSDASITSESLLVTGKTFDEVVIAQSTLLGFAKFCGKARGIRVELARNDDLLSSSADPVDAENALSGWVLHEDWVEIQLISPEQMSKKTDRSVRWLKLALHEIGHVALHYPSLRKRLRGKKKADAPFPPIATREEEAEAWFFASVVHGLALAAVAWDQRHNRRIGAVCWLA
jgi:hypothetical protein